MRLQGKNAFVTGGSRGIGKSICLALAKEGANIAFTFKDNAHLANEVVNEIEGFGVDAISYKCDVRERKIIKEIFNQIENNWNNIDILVNNAGINNPTDFDKITDDDWDEVLSVNLKGPFIVSQECLPLLEKVLLLVS